LVLQILVVETSNVLTIFAVGSIGAGKHLFFDTLNINFRDQDGMYKVHSNNYSYKGKEYKYILHLIAGSFIDPSLLPAQRIFCDAVILLANPLVQDVFHYIEKIIVKIAEAHPNTLIALIMQNIFGDLDNLTPDGQEIALFNGEMFCELENNYNLKLVSLNYSVDEISSLESGNPTVALKFFKMFNQAFYEIIHESIERHEHPEIRGPVIRPESE
jgi:hypothetical protein